MTIDRIKNLREFCTNNYDLLPTNKLFSITLDSYDTNGGLDFEEKVTDYSIGKKTWLCKSSTEKTIQPAFGHTITSENDVHISELSDSDFLTVLEKNPKVLPEFEEFISSVMKINANK